MIYRYMQEGIVGWLVIKYLQVKVVWCRQVKNNENEDKIKIFKGRTE